MRSANYECKIELITGMAFFFNTSASNGVMLCRFLQQPFFMSYQNKYMDDQCCSDNSKA